MMTDAQFEAAQKLAKMCEDERRSESPETDQMMEADRIHWENEQEVSITAYMRMFCLARRMEEVFERVETLYQSSHDWRYVLRCRECGQLYLFDFHEDIDWEAGDDPSWVTYLPIAGDALDRPAELRQMDLRAHRPYFMKDWPKGMEKPVKRWVVDTGPAGRPGQVH